MVLLIPAVLKVAITWYLINSIILFSCYGLDKAQAVNKGRRIPENLLHILALSGGFPGGLLGRSIFHHKTRKPVFLIILFLSAIVHILIWLFIIISY
ncbi:MAG TPA: DUF1294 domain-containing protein [Leptolinea sp.]